MSTTSTETKTAPHVVFEVELRVPVAVPLATVKEYYPDTAVDDLRGYEAEELTAEYMADALDEFFDNAPDISVNDQWEEDRELPEKFATTRPEKGQRYTLPVPSMGSGIGIFWNDETKSFDATTESSVNKLTDDQAKGAHYMVTRMWQMSDTRRQKERVLGPYSEIEWLMFARPSLHYFSPGDDGMCKCCGQIEDGHDVRKESSDD